MAPLDDVEPDEFGYTDLEESTAQAESAESAVTWQQVVEDDDLDEMPLH